MKANKANFKLILRTDHKDKAGLSPVFLRITSYYKVKYISTGRKVQGRYWNKGRREVRSSHPDAVELNQYLEDFLRAARERFRESSFNVDAVDRNTDVISFITNTVLQNYNKGEQFRTRQRYITLKNKLVEFAGPKIPFDTINKTFLEEFNSFLQLSSGNAINTRIKYLDMLRCIFSLGIEAQVVTGCTFPKMKLRKEQCERRRLSIDEIKRLQEYDAPINSVRYHAKNMFLLSFFTGGGRWEDIVLVRFSGISDGFLRYVQSKTGKPFELALIPEAKGIIDLYAYRSDKYKYIFPFMEDVPKEDIIRFKMKVNMYNSLINNQLAIIAKHLGIEKFTFHAARHSVSDVLRKKGVDLYTISKMLCHSGLKSTERYLAQTDFNAVSAAFAHAFEKEET